MGPVLQVLPFVHEVAPWNHALNFGNVLVAHAPGEEVHHDRAGLDRVAKIVHRLARLHHLAQFATVDLGHGPMRMQDLEPAFFVEGAHDVQRIVLVRELFQLVANRPLPDVLDVVVLFGGLVTRLGAVLQRPVEARAQAGRPVSAALALPGRRSCAAREAL